MILKPAFFINRFYSCQLTDNRQLFMINKPVIKYLQVHSSSTKPTVPAYSVIITFPLVIKLNTPHPGTKWIHKRLPNIDYQLTKSKLLEGHRTNITLIDNIILINSL